MPVEFNFDAAQYGAVKYACPLVVSLDLHEMTDEGNGGQLVEVIGSAGVMVVEVKPRRSRKTEPTGTVDENSFASSRLRDWLNCLPSCVALICRFP